MHMAQYLPCPSVCLLQPLIFAVAIVRAGFRGEGSKGPGPQASHQLHPALAIVWAYQVSCFYLVLWCARAIVGDNDILDRFARDLPLPAR